MEEERQKALNSKILFELLPEDKQPQKTIFAPNMDLMKFAKVLSVGKKVEDVKVGDIITIYVTTMVMLKKTIGFCSERDVILTNNIPPKGKIHINQQSKEGITVLMNANVINSNSEDIDTGDQIYYKVGNSHQLPDNTEIISEQQVYYKL